MTNHEGVAMKKIEIPREVAEAIEALRAEKYSNFGIIDLYVNGEYGARYKHTLRKIATDDLMTALVVGYVIEKTPEEKREEAYESIRKQYNNAYYLYDEDGDIYRDGIEDTLDWLDIKIEGVNV